MHLFHVINKRDGLEIKDELHFDGKEYFTCEYNRVKKRMTQVGVSIEGARLVLVKQFDREVARLTLDQESNYWYHKKKQWIEDGYNQITDSIFGINAGGSFDVLAYNEKNEEIGKATVNITPGTMSIKEYKQMQEEVRRLFELFSYDLSAIDKNEENLLKRVQLPFYPQGQLKELISRFTNCFNEISQMPEYELIHLEKKINIHQVKKWSPSIIIEDSIKQNGKVTALISKKTSSIREHRMIKYMIEDFLQKIDMELQAEQNYLKVLSDELRQLEEVEKREQSYLVNNFRNLKKIIISDCEKLGERIKNWNWMRKEIVKLLDNSLLQCESEFVEETHLFRMHTSYSEIFRIYSEFEDLSPILSDTFRLFVQSILKSPTLYEIWILLKIIQELSQWGINPYEFIVDLKEIYLKKKSLSGYRKHFKLNNKPFDIGLYYDCTFTDSGYRPDFVIGFFDKKGNKWFMHTLDAKYKSYSKMKISQRKILNDLRHSGTRYLNELFNNIPNVVLQSATLVHTDIESINWNVKHVEVNPNFHQHRIGHFNITPYESKNLGIYLKRLLHECSNFECCCPKCGNTVEGIVEEKDPYHDKLRWKTTYTCEECEEVWVANFCGTCSYYDRGMRKIKRQGKIYRYPRPLYKYPINNYNLQVEDNWDVHCPTCNKTANHWLSFNMQEDVLKGTILLNH